MPCQQRQGEPAVRGIVMETQEASGVAVVRKAYNLFAEGKAEVLGLFAPDAQWHFPGRSVLAGDHTGREGIGAFLLKFGELSGSTYRASVVDAAEGEEHVFVLHHSQAQRNGKTSDFTVCQLMTVRDGLITEAWTHPYDLRALDEFWS
jgi:ketosteroid isomerase-like protein